MYVNAVGKELLKSKCLYTKKKSSRVFATNLVLACLRVMIDIEGQ